jgi:hypothetical protein
LKAIHPPPYDHRCHQNTLIFLINPNLLGSPPLRILAKLVKFQLTHIRLGLIAISLAPCN